MVRIARQQSAELGRSITAAEDAAKASNRSAKAMEGSLTHTKASADAAQKTASILQDTAERQLRAYMMADQMSLVDGRPVPNIDPPVYKGCPVGIVVIKNLGNTPAYYVRHHSRVDICAPEDVNSLCLPADISELTPTMIAASSPTRSEPNLGRPLSVDEVEKLTSLKLFLVVHGKIVYNDVFGIQRETTYRLAYAGAYPPPQGVNLIFTPGGNSAT